jgi:Asp-tRNA(Asn)/Glu-tRNA(Gln) amidotransferase A subunit family amidase
VLGKTVTTEFAYFAPGPTANPWDLSRTPGGSSSGSAAAVAAGFCSLALGTQTIGSISRPAAYCGITGWKPSYERTSREGVVPFSPSLDHVGLLAPTASDVAAAAPLVAAEWDTAAYDVAKARYGKMRPILAIPDGRYLAQAESAALAAFEATVARLYGAGFSIIRIPAFDDIDDINARHRRIAAADMERTHRAWFEAHGGLYAKATRELIAKGAAIDDNELELDRSGRATLRTALERQLEEAGADFWLSPAAPGPAPLGLDSTGSPLMNLPWTNAGLPTLALPTCQSVDGMPMGIQLAAAFGADESLLALGAVIETALSAPR